MVTEFDRQQIQDYVGQVLAGTLPLTKIPVAFLWEVMEEAFFEASGRKCTLNQYMKLCTMSAFLRHRKADSVPHHCTR